MKKIIAVIIALFSFTITNGQEHADLVKIYSKEYKKDLKKKDIVGMSLGIIDHTKIVHIQNFGFEDKENNTMTSSTTEYKIGSISKVFTALAILKLHEQGLIDIEHSIKEYIPELNIKSRFTTGNDLKIKDILCHSAGLPSDIINGMFSKNPKDFDWVVSQLNTQYLTSPAKFEMSYSNLGYGLLGELIKRVSNMSYVDYMKKEIFTPLGMNSSYVFNGETSLSKAYINGEVYSPDRIRDQAAGSVVSTVDDMLLFIDYLMNENKSKNILLRKDESFKLLETNLIENNILKNSHGYSAGLFLHMVELEKKGATEKDLYLEHGGDTHAFHAHFGYLKERKIGGVILTNSKRGGSINSVTHLLKIYLDKIDNAKLTRKYRTLKKQTTPLNDTSIIGEYAFAHFLVTAANRDKFDLNLGNQKIVLKKKANTDQYKIRPIVMGFIPIPVKSVYMEFVEIEDQIYVIQERTKSKKFEIIGAKIPEHKLHDAWKNKTGSYKILNAIETNFEALNMSNDTCTIEIDENKLKINFGSDWIMESVYFIANEEKMAYSIGIGRNNGYSLTILENGNLSFLGYELKKIKN